MCWHFPSFLSAEIAQVVEIIPCGRQGPVYHILLIPLMTWRQKEPGHQQLWC